jgi:hypothetical protein
VVGYVGTGSRETDAFRLPAFHQGLSESGYVEAETSRLNIGGRRVTTIGFPQ